jgi:aryl-alcohol dehydrogenase-like predicted oxidoreductase
MERKISLGQSGLQVTRIGLGAMTWGQPKGLSRWTPAQMAYGPAQSAAEEERALQVSLAAGVDLIDTAEFYSNGASEKRVGELAHGRDILIATKFPPSPFSTTTAFPKALADSLARLKRSEIDLFQHHFPSQRIPIPQLMNVMADAVQAGKVRAVGVSNYSAEQMRLAHTELARRGLPLASNQVEYSLLHRKPEVDGVLEACLELGVTLIAYSPLAMGALTGKYSAQKQPAGLRRFLGTFRGQAIQAVQPVVSLLREIGGRYSRTPSQVALRWLVEKGNVLPIPGAKNSSQAAENVGALSFSLSAAEVEALDQVTLAWRV